MRRYILTRLCQTVLTLVILSMVVFCLVRFSGDPALLMVGEYATEKDYQYMRAQLGLDKPIYSQYWVFIANAVRSDFGKSIRTKRPVAESIKEALPNSGKLTLVGMIIALGLSFPLGVMAAVKKNSYVDKMVRLFAGLGQSLPAFWVGLMLMHLFVVQLRILPAAGMGSWKHYVMPAFCIGFFLMAGIIRLLRSTMLEVLDTEYIRLARIKGLPERAVVWKHALRNSLLPILSFGGMYIAITVTGAILIETVFAWPGFGRLAYMAIVNQDFPLIQGVVLTTAGLVILVNLVTDILYAYLDPRIRYR